MSIELYVFPPSPRAFRVMAVANHLGIETTLRLVDLAKGDQKTPEFAALNPNRFAPAMSVRSLYRAPYLNAAPHPGSRSNCRDLQDAAVRRPSTRARTNDRSRSRHSLASGRGRTGTTSSPPPW
jgi:Glutathione S-transferase, N-terminal domain